MNIPAFQDHKKIGFKNVTYFLGRLTMLSKF